MIATTLTLLLASAAAGAALPDLSTVPPDLETPALTRDAPAAGRRVRQTTAGWQGTDVYHALYLPTNWQRGRKFPVLVEYAGNGGYRNQFGDVSEGTVEGSNLGFGISGGVDYIWVCLPFVCVQGGKKENALTWWGDAQETVRYCTATVRAIYRDLGGDPEAVVLCGFSRGAIACNYIGLHDDTIAPLWRAFICHSHYDGLYSWYRDADPAQALERLRRLNGRPQFISHEGSTRETRRYLEGTGVKAPFTFLDLPFRNHSDQWVLRDGAPRLKLRAWLKSLGLPAILPAPADP